MDTKTEQVIDICDAFRLEATEPKHIDKKVYLSQLKSAFGPCSPLLLTPFSQHSQ